MYDHRPKTKATTARTVRLVVPALVMCSMAWNSATALDRRSMVATAACPVAGAPAGGGLTAAKDLLVCVCVTSAMRGAGEAWWLYLDSVSMLAEKSRGKVAVLTAGYSGTALRSCCSSWFIIWVTGRCSR